MVGDERDAIGSARSELIAGLLEWGLACGITKVITAFEPVWVLYAMQLRFCVRPLGLQRKIGGLAVVATELSFDPATLATVRAFRRHSAPVAQFCGQLGERIPTEARIH
jgi:acyl-homoserine lactone synthase